MGWAITRAEADSIVAQTPPVEGKPSPADLWKWAQSYVSGGPECESAGEAGGRVAEQFNLPSTSLVQWKLDGWEGFKPRELAYELHFALQGNTEESAAWRERRLRAP